MSVGFKAVISQNKYGRYEVSIERDLGPDYLPSQVAWDVTYTLKGARRKAPKLLAKARHAQDYPKVLEEIR